MCVELRRVLRWAIEKLQPRFEPDDESDTQEYAYDVGEKFVRTEDEKGAEAHLVRQVEVLGLTMKPDLPSLK